MKKVTEQILTMCHSFVLQYKMTGPNPGSPTLIKIHYKGGGGMQLFLPIGG
jgi:hypothetical protein